jgi:predicted amino acid racemase
LYKELIEARFNKNMPYVSGGSSVTIPLLIKDLLPEGITHFRIGETLFFGRDLYHNKHIEGMKKNIFRLFGEIIELSEKPMVPSGQIGMNVSGETRSFDNKDIADTSYRAIMDFGLLDIDEDHVHPQDEDVEIAGASSDMIVLDLGENEKQYKVGDLIEFKLDYMGALSILNSNYIEKKII